MLCFLRSISFFTPQAPHSKQRQREDSLQKHITDASRNANTNLAKKLAAFSTQLTLLYVRKKTQDRLQTYNGCSFGLRKQEKNTINEQFSLFTSYLSIIQPPSISSLFLELYIHPKHSTLLLLPPVGLM